MTPTTTLLLLLLLLSENAVQPFNLVLMGRARRGKGGLKENLDDGGSNKKGGGSGTRGLNKGKGQEITGVTLPADGSVKGWEFGEKKTMACAQVDGRFFALEGQCPRCAFDLWKGDLISDDPAWEDLPRIACPTCSTTYSMANGKKGPPLKRTGLAGFVGKLAKTATVDSSSADAKVFLITRDDDGRVFCRER